jgi:hypothetical protein
MTKLQTKLQARKRALMAERRRIVRHIGDHGPTPGNELAAALGMTVEKFWEAIDGNTGWFRITAKGWSLSRKGRAELRAMGGATGIATATTATATATAA